MEDFEKEVVKEIVKQLPFKEIYEDGAKPLVQSSSTVANLVLRSINAALEPLHKWVLHREYNIEETKILLQQKLLNVPYELIVSPEPYVAIPALQSISYTIDSHELRDMYASLLAKSMNANQKKFVHPSFVEIIKQLSPNEAVFLNYLKGYRKALIDYEFQFDGFGGCFGQNLIDLSGKFGQQDIMSYINNFIRLGLFEKILSDRNSCLVEFEIVEKIAFKECKLAMEEDYEHEFFKSELSKAFNCHYYWLQLTKLGESFVEIVLNN